MAFTDRKEMVISLQINLTEVKSVQQSILKLESDASIGNANRFRTIFKTQHGRALFLSLESHGSACTITDCFYLDRNQGREGPARYSAKPKKLQTGTSDWLVPTMLGCNHPAANLLDRSG